MWTFRVVVSDGWANGGLARHMRWLLYVNYLNIYYKQDCIRARRLTQVLRKAEVMCRLCRLAPESVPNILSSRAALAQNKYLFGHNIQFSNHVILRSYKTWNWSSLCHRGTPNQRTKVKRSNWDVSAYAEQQEVRMNKVDAYIINHKTKQVITLEMSCALIANREKKSEEKTLKYGPLRWEWKQQ